MAGATAWHLAACFLLLALRQHGQAQPSAPSNATAGLNTTLAAQEGGTKPELPIETGQTPPMVQPATTQHVSKGARAWLDDD